MCTYVLRLTAFNRFRGADREKLNAGFGWKPGSRMPTTVYNKLRPQDVLETLIEEDTQVQSKGRTRPGHRRGRKDDHKLPTTFILVLIVLGNMFMWSILNIFI